MIAEDRPRYLEKRVRLWRKGIETPYSPTHISSVARQIIGCLESTTAGKDPRGLSKVIRIKYASAKWLIREIWESKHPIIKRAREFGLPIEAAAWLPRYMKMRCKVCGTLLRAVPCLRCLELAGDRHDASLVPMKRRYVSRREPESTLHLPGTAEKIGVMRQRFEAGMSVFSPKDAVFTPAKVSEEEGMPNGYHHW